MDIYICPMCKQENGEHQKYCLNCGKWLLDPTFPAIKKEKRKKKSRNYFGAIMLILAAIGAYWFLSNGGTLAVPVSKMYYDPIENEYFRFSQLEITNSSVSSIPVDFEVKKDFDHPIEVVAVFYDGEGNRIARASTIITRKLTSGYETTLVLKLDNPANLMKSRSLRMETNPLAPFELLEKAVEAIQ